MQQEQPTSQVKLTRELKQIALRMYYEEKNPNSYISQTLGIKRTTLQEFLKKYERTQSLEKGKSTGRPKVLTNQQKEIICDWVDSNCSLT